MNDLIQRVESIIEYDERDPNRKANVTPENIFRTLESAFPSRDRHELLEALAKSKYCARYTTLLVEEGYYADGNEDEMPWFLNAVSKDKLEVKFVVEDGGNTFSDVGHTPYNVARAIESLLEELAALEDLPTGFSNLEIEPKVLGQLMMEKLPDPDSPMETDERIYWMQVADHMGPDWIQALRKVASYMQKVESF